MIASNNSSVWYYGVLDGRTMRAPINLRTREIDWSRAEPYTEPPSRVPDDEPVRNPEIVYRRERERKLTRARVRRFRAKQQKGK